MQTHACHTEDLGQWSDVDQGQSGSQCGEPDGSARVVKRDSDSPCTRGKQKQDSDGGELPVVRSPSLGIQG